ncbi:ABC transporter permease [Natranaerofaba carboxydovora]|uniref:ABC transporter permease n=1 Tax=Natranaerofaba carboxydovora TaxID=2742683 RepID=UPI001F142502|nr:FtsX-like permease family protein [Natranaerofaba carboxydovora]UMZ74576.1 Macrolide export ATP-binding/permease protein MacB [Natranaerofaba carboxydovora]
MSLVQIALNNLKRRKLKIFFIVFSLVIAVATVTSLYVINTSMQRQVGEQMDEFGANLVVAPKSEGLSLTYGGVPLPGVTYHVEEINEDAVERIESIHHADSLNIISPKVIGSTTISGEDGLIVGLDFAKELRLKPWWDFEDSSKPKIDFVYDGMEEDQTIIGKRVAESFGKGIGDEIEVDGESFEIAGVLEGMGAEEDGIVFISLDRAQSILDREGEYSLIEVSAYCTECPITTIEEEISEELPEAEVMALREEAVARDETIQGFSNFSLAVSTVVVLIGILIVVTTMMSSVNERVREIGVFRAIGYRKSHVMKIFLLEAVILSGAGGIIGYLAGYVTALMIGPSLGELNIQLGFEPLLLLFSIILSVTMGVIGTLYPAYKASNLNPTEALRLL